ncbi:MAG: hypothetical protein RR574_19520, partial [Comamonas sp.]
MAKAVGVKTQYAVIALIVERRGDYRISRHFVTATPWLSPAGFLGLDEWVAEAKGISSSNLGQTVFDPPSLQIRPTNWLNFISSNGHLIPSNVADVALL